MDTDDLVSEALENSRGDRSVLEGVRDRLVALVEAGNQPAPDDDDPRAQGQFAVVAVSENIVQLTEALTRVNNQLVELAKIKARQKPGHRGGEDIYDLIEKGLSTGS